MTPSSAQRREHRACQRPSTPHTTPRTHRCSIRRALGVLARGLGRFKEQFAIHGSLNRGRESFRPVNVYNLQVPGTRRFTDWHATSHVRQQEFQHCTTARTPARDLESRAGAEARCITKVLFAASMCRASVTCPSAGRLLAVSRDGSCARAQERGVPKPRHLPQSDLAAHSGCTARYTGTPQVDALCAFQTSQQRFCHHARCSSTCYSTRAPLAPANTACGWPRHKRGLRRFSRTGGPSRGLAAATSAPRAEPAVPAAEPAPPCVRQDSACSMKSSTCEKDSSPPCARV